MNSNLLKRYFENQCSPQERREVSDWLSDEVNKAEAMRLMEAMWNEHVEDARNDYAGGGQSVSPVQGVKRISTSRRRILRWSAVAAVVTVLLGIAASIVVNWGAPTGNTFTQAVNPGASTAEVVVQNSPGISASQVEEGSEALAERQPEPSVSGPRETRKSVATTGAQPRTIQASTMTKAQLVNEQRFLDLLASLDSTALTELFTYRHTHLSEILSDIQKKYNLEIAVCDDSLNHMIVKKEFDAVNLRELLFQIRKEIDLTYAVKGNQILICFNKEK